MRDLERRYRRLLRWYPARWRRAHEEIVLALLMEAAEADKRERPRWAEWVSAGVHGLAARLDRRLGLGAGIAALAISVLSSVASVWGWSGGLGAAVIAVTLGIVPALCLLGVICWARGRGVLGDLQALAVLVSGTAAFGFAGGAGLAWSLGFEAADEGLPATGWATLWAPLSVLTVTCGALAVSVALAPLLRRAGWPTPLAVLLSGGAGAVSTVVGTLTLLYPVTSAGLSVFVVLLLMQAGPGARSVAQPTRPAAKRPLPEAVSAMVGVLATVAFVGSGLAVAYLFTGTTWGAADGTAAVAGAITMLALSGLPLLGAAGVVVASTPAMRAGVLGPLVLLGLALCAVAGAYQFTPGWDAMMPWMQASAILQGAALAWLIGVRAPMARTARVVVGVGVGLLQASFLGVILTPALTFAVPIVAAVIVARAVLGWRRRRMQPVMS